MSIKRYCFEVIPAGIDEYGIRPAVAAPVDSDCGDWVNGDDHDEVTAEMIAVIEEHGLTIQKIEAENAALKEENERLKARVAELEAMKPVYCVASGRYDSYMNELYSITDKPIPMADNFVLYRKEPANGSPALPISQMPPVNHNEKFCPECGGFVIGVHPDDWIESQQCSCKGKSK